MYIAGLNISLSNPKWLEVLVVLSTADFIRYFISKMRCLSVVSESTAGPVRPESMPRSFLGRVISPIHGLAIWIPPLVYVGALVLNRFQQPNWMAAYVLPDVDLKWKNTSRVATCIATVALKSFVESILTHLGDQWHVIGRRERPRIVKTGPYAWVRHPVYSSVLLQEVLWSVMFWSYIPLIAFGITALAFAIKIPIEESLIQDDDAVRDEYQRYMKQVPARILPYVW